MRPPSLQALAALNIGWPVLAACSIAAVCTARAASDLRRIATLCAPQPENLLKELFGALAAQDGRSENIRRAAVAELNQRLSDVSFELGLLPARFTALTRICLSSGMALGLFGYIGSNGRTSAERLIGLVVCALGGLIGAGTVLAIGRAAKRRAGLSRVAWDRASREVGKALGTTLANPSARFER